MKASSGTYFGFPVITVCDMQCDKAWGNNQRPYTQLSDDEDDFEWYSDGELGKAPTEPGTWEGRDTKPASPQGIHNKWCVRECERSVMVSPGESFELPDFSERASNIDHRATIPTPENTLAGEGKVWYAERRD